MSSIVGRQTQHVLFAVQTPFAMQLLLLCGVTVHNHQYVTCMHTYEVC